MAKLLRVKRDVLSLFLPDHQSIVAFENIFEVVSADIEAINVITDVTNFDKVLSSADVNVQLALETIDELSHTQIKDIGSNTHAQIDSHISDLTIHFTEASIDHLNIQNIGTNSHAQIDTHIADGTIHFTEGSISHLNIQDIGTNSHTAIDNHISDATIHFTVDPDATVSNVP